MITSDLPFPLSANVAKLVEEVESLAQTEVMLREGEFNRFDEPASVQGGFDQWRPHVTVNATRRTEFDEHGLAHELLHIRRFLLGAPSLETPETVAGVRSLDAEVRKAFASDVTNQIEHAAIFPQLEALGFDPYALANEWIDRQTREMPPRVGEVERTWLAIKVGLAPFMSSSESIQQAHRLAVQKVAPSAIAQGDEIGAIVKRYGLEKPYNLKRLYQQILRAAGLPKGVLLLKTLDFNRQLETREPIP